MEPNDIIFFRLCLPPENVSAGRDENYGSPKIDSAAVELNDLTFRRLRLPPGNVFAGRDGNYGSPKIDSAAVELIDLICRRLSFQPEECPVGWETAAVACGEAQQDDMIFRRTIWPPDEFAAGWKGDYLRPDLWTGPSVCNQPVTESLAFGSSQKLGRCCLWLAALPSHWIGTAEVPMRLHLLLAVSSSEPHEVTLLSQLAGMQLWSGASMIWSYSWILHCVGTLYGQMAEVYLLNCTCIWMIHVSVCCSSPDRVTFRHTFF